MIASSVLSMPCFELRGELSIPGDKSISHRALLLSALATGTSSIRGLLTAKDCLATFKALQMMGVVIRRESVDLIRVHGVGKTGLQQPKTPIDCANSGTTMRLLTGVLAGQSFATTLIGDESLQKRPMDRIRRPLNLMGANINTTGSNPPIYIGANAFLQGICYPLPIASAQVKSAILLAGLYAQGDTSVIETQITRDHTEKMLQTFGCTVEKNANKIRIKNNQELCATEITIPGDLSSAAFFIVAATLIPGSSLLIKNVGINPTRAGVLSILALMGADITVLDERLYGQEPVANLRVRYAPLKGINIPQHLVSIAIDEFPILFIAASLAKGETYLEGAAELRTKESDRIEVMVQGLRKLGVSIDAFDDGVRITGGVLQGGEINSFGDHRIAMAFIIAGSVAASAVKVKNCQNIDTSFPQFITSANSINLRVKECNG